MTGSVEARLEAIEERLSSLERRVAERAPRPAEPPLSRADQAAEWRPPAPRPPAPEPPERTPHPPARRPDAAARPLDLEELFGGRILAWIGGSAVVLGIVLFLVTAVRRGWIDEPTRVVLAFLGSTALLVLGVWLHERRGRLQAALATVAAAIAGLYASTTAATSLYDLFSPTLGLALAALIGATATAIAVRWSSPVVGAIGILGALLAPVLVDAGASTVTLAFVAVALVAAVAVLLWQGWSWLAVGAFAVSAPQLASWVEANHRERLALALGLLLAFWAIYVIAAIGYELRVPTERQRLSSALLLFANVVAIAGGGYWLLEDHGRPLGANAWVLVLAALHVALGIGVLRSRASREVGGLLVALGTALSAIGFALVLSGPALVAGWSVHAVVLFWLARRLDDERAFLGGAAFLAGAAVHVLAFEAPPSALVEGLDELSRAAVAIGLVAGTALAGARLARPGRLPWRDLLETLGAAFVVYLGSIAIVDATHETGRGERAQALVSAFWSVTGLAALVFGLLRDERRIRLGGLVLLAVAVVKVFLYDLSTLESLYRVLSFVALGLLSLAGAFAYQRIRLTVAEGDDT